MASIRIISQSQLLKNQKLYFSNDKNISSTGSIFACLPNNLILVSWKSLNFAFLSLLETLQYSAVLWPGLLTHEGDDTSLQHALCILDGGHHISFLTAASTAATETVTAWNDSPSMQEYQPLSQTRPNNYSCMSSQDLLLSLQPANPKTY